MGVEPLAGGVAPHPLQAQCPKLPVYSYTRLTAISGLQAYQAELA